MAELEPATPQRTANLIDTAEAYGRRLPFTLSTLALVALAGWLTRTATGARLGARTITRLGFAPADTASFDLVRAVMSAFVTNDAFAFWLAIVCIAVFTGGVEWRFGSARATIAFWGTHLIVLAFSWVVLLSLHLAGSTSASLLYVARDVGPSAGYVGCLGYLMTALPSRWRSLSLAIGVIVFSAMLAFQLAGLDKDPESVSAAISHLMALPIGFTLGVLTGTPRARKGAGG